MSRLREQYLDQVSNILKSIRSNKKLNTREAAELIGIHQPQLVRVETKKHELRLNNLEAILNALGYEVEIELKIKKIK